MAVASWLDRNGPLWQAPQVQWKGRRRKAVPNESQWSTPLPYEVEQSLLFLIDEGGWMLSGHGRTQRWSNSERPPWRTALCRRMGAHAEHDVEVRKLWHGRGEVGHGQLQGAEAILTQGGNAIVEDENERQVHASRSRAIKVGERRRHSKRRIGSRRYERWRGR